MKTRHAILTLIVLLVSYIINRTPSLSPEPVFFPSLPTLEPNTYLTNALHLDGLPGPESFTLDHQRYLYVSLLDGRIVRSTSPLPTGPKATPEEIHRSLRFTDFVRTGVTHEQCGTYDYEPICGRPLGLEYDSLNHKLLVADAYKGLLSVDLETQALNSLCSSFKAQSLQFSNSLALDEKTGFVYFTDSSRFQRRDVVYEALESGSSGRLMVYFPANHTCTVVLDRLSFPNGVTTTHDGDSLLIDSYTTSSVLRLHLRTGALDLFSTDLPGHPDNIKRRLNGETYYVALGSRRAQPFALSHSLGPYPLLRHVVARLVPPSWMFQLIPKHGVVAELDASGKVVRTLQDPTGRTSWISEVFEVQGGTLLLGSFRNPFLALVSVPSS